MARTDVHRPLWVQEADPHARSRFLRFYSLDNPELWPLYNVCCCHLCRGPSRKIRRRQRYDGRRALRAQRWDDVAPAASFRRYPWP